MIGRATFDFLQVSLLVSVIRLWYMLCGSAKKKKMVKAYQSRTRVKACYKDAQFFLIICLLLLVSGNSFSLPSGTCQCSISSTTSCKARRSNDRYDDDEYDDEYDNYEEDEYDRMWKRRQRPIDDLGGFDESRRDLDVPSSFGRRDGWRLPESVSKALLAGVFVLGIGLGVTVDSAINTNPKDLASRDAVDQAAPNPTLCATMGASAMAFDQRVFVSFNPFNVYVAQADVKPACVLRPANVVPILKDRKLINDDEVRSCKANMNTWAFVGDLTDTPQLSCVYRSQDAQNEFLSNPKFGIGEDYLDDDRANLKKQIKDGLTNGQKENLRQQASQIGIN